MVIDLSKLSFLFIWRTLYLHQFPLAGLRPVTQQWWELGAAVALLLPFPFLFPPLPLTAPESGQSLPLNKTDRV